MQESGDLVLHPTGWFVIKAKRASDKSKVFINVCSDPNVPLRSLGLDPSNEESTIQDDVDSPTFLSGLRRTKGKDGGDAWVIDVIAHPMLLESLLDNDVEGKQEIIKQALFMVSAERVKLIPGYTLPKMKQKGEIPDFVAPRSSLQTNAAPPRSFLDGFDEPGGAQNAENSGPLGAALAKLGRTNMTTGELREVINTISAEENGAPVETPDLDMREISSPAKTQAKPRIEVLSETSTDDKASSKPAESDDLVISPFSGLFQSGKPPRSVVEVPNRPTRLRYNHKGLMIDGKYKQFPFVIDRVKAIHCTDDNMTRVFVWEAYKDVAEKKPAPSI